MTLDLVIFLDMYLSIKWVQDVTNAVNAARSNALTTGKSIERSPSHPRSRTTLSRSTLWAIALTPGECESVAGVTGNGHKVLSAVQRPPERFYTNARSLH